MHSCNHHRSRRLSGVKPAPGSKPIARPKCGSHPRPKPTCAGAANASSSRARPSASGCSAWPKKVGRARRGRTVRRRRPHIDENRVLQQELNRINARPALSSFGIWMLGPALLEFANEAQKLEHLPKIVRGEIRWCQGYSEPGAGSDLASLADDRLIRSFRRRCIGFRRSGVLPFLSAVSAEHRRTLERFSARTIEFQIGSWSNRQG